MFSSKQPNIYTTILSSPRRPALGLYIGVLTRTVCDLDHAHCECEMKGGFQDPGTQYLYYNCLPLGVQLALLMWVMWEMS